jgi:hypothetical protein
MRLPGAPSWAAQKKRCVRAGAPQSAGLSVAGPSKAVPGVPAYAKVVTNGEKIKDFLRRSVGPVVVLAKALYELAGVPESNPLLLFYAKNHRSELDACSRHLSRYLAVVFFAACSGWPLVPAQAWAKFRIVNDDGSERSKLETQCFYNDSRTGVCAFSAVIRACPARAARAAPFRLARRKGLCSAPPSARRAGAAAAAARASGLQSALAAGCSGISASCARARALQPCTCTSCQP